MRSLLDVNVLIALLDTQHLHHAAASDWFARHARQGWATCAITQSGCLRIVSQPACRHHVSVRLIADALRQATAESNHEFWADTLTLLEPGTLDWNKLLTGRQPIDIYLLALAVRHDGRLVTLGPRHSDSGGLRCHGGSARRPVEQRLFQ